jgi:hypothetical protein
MSNPLTFGRQFLASFPLIKVRNTDTGETHVVGTNHHDYLYVTEDGTISYVNLQNYGTIGDGYEFVYEQVSQWSEESEHLGKEIPFAEATEFERITEEVKGYYADLDKKIAAMAEHFFAEHAPKEEKNNV